MGKKLRKTEATTAASSDRVIDKGTTKKHDAKPETRHSPMTLAQRKEIQRGKACAILTEQVALDLEHSDSVLVGDDTQDTVSMARY